MAALSPADQDYGLAGHISEREDHDHLLHSWVVRLRNLISEEDIMGYGTVVLSLEPEDGTVFEIRCSLREGEMRLTPVLIRSKSDRNAAVTS